MIHPARSAVESLHADGACPRLQVDLTREGIVCPDFVCEKWKERLVIDLDPSYPLNLEFTDTGIDVDLSFGGYVTRCTFPFDAIYAVADRETGKGIAIEKNVPESMRRKPGVVSPSAPRPGADGKRTAGGRSRRRRRPGPKDEPSKPAALVPAAVVAAPASDDDGDGTAPEVDATTEENAQRRRSVFQVIDGDG